jgi:hypothetical protein
MIYLVLFLIGSFFARLDFFTCSGISLSQSFSSFVKYSFYNIFLFAHDPFFTFFAVLGYPPSTPSQLHQAQGSDPRLRGTGDFAAKAQHGGAVLHAHSQRPAGPIQIVCDVDIDVDIDVDVNVDVGVHVDVMLM